MLCCTLVLFAACDEERPELYEPIIQLSDAIDITHNSATIGTSVIPQGGHISSCTIYYGTSPSSLTNSITLNGTQGDMQAQLSSLQQNTTYYYMLVISNGYNTLQSEVRNFTTTEEPQIEEPPTEEPPTEEPPTEEPPADEPPTDEPPTEEPPTDEPPTEQNDSVVSIQTSRTIHLTVMGTLADSISAEERTIIKELKVIGDINADDWNVIAYMCGEDYDSSNYEGVLEVLDLSEANIVGGGQALPYYAPLYDDTFHEYAFQFSKTLKTLVIPNTLKTIIGFGLECTSLQDFVTTEACQNFKAVDGILYNKNITRLVSYPPNHAYTETFQIPSTVTTIGQFSLFAVLTADSIAIPTSVTTIEKGAFYMLSRGHYDYPQGNPKPLVVPSTVTSIDESVFQESGLAEVDIEAQITTLPPSLFRGCTFFLRKVTLPSTLTTIKDSFGNCAGITSIHFQSSTPPTYVGGTYNDLNHNGCVLYVPKGSLSAYQKSEVWGAFKNIVEE